MRESSMLSGISFAAGKSSIAGHRLVGISRTTTFGEMEW
jgi:hypothetical protein